MITKGMLPKEMAEKLIQKWHSTQLFWNEAIGDYDIDNAKEAALVEVKGILSVFREDQMTPSKWWWENVREELEGKDVEEVEEF